jgi:CheY-like chemotaxis protein
MGGTIEVQSRPGYGSEFRWTARLQQVAPPAGRDAGMPTSPRPVTVPPQSITVLVADDDQTNQLLLQRLLERHGLSVRVASNGYEVLSELVNGGIDLVLMDIQMPGLNGIQTTIEIRRNEVPTKRRLPVIALTADVQQTVREECFRVGMNGFISKPIDPDELYAVITEHSPV